MRVALVLPYYSGDAATLEQILARYELPRLLPPELAALGHDLTMFVLAARDADLTRDNVRYVAVRSHRSAVWLGRGMQRLRPSLGAAYWEPALRLARRVRASHPDIMHVFGLTLDVNLALLVRAAQQAHAPVVVQFHGGVPSGGRRIRRLQRWSLARVARVLFTHPEQARPWIDAGLIPGWERVEQVVETSVAIKPLPRDAARAQTGLHGDPLCLAVGHLNAGKDPLTTLRGFARIAAARPEARLYFFYQTDALAGALRAELAQLPDVASRVEFRGPVPRHELPAIYSSADILLQASLREWSSLSVMEAMACGCIPVISRIPAFETLTANGRFGRLFPVGDPAALADAVLALDAATRATLSLEVRRHFEEELSFPALARRMDEVYEAVSRQPSAISSLRGPNDAGTA